MQNEYKKMFKNDYMLAMGTNEEFDSLSLPFYYI